MELYPLLTKVELASLHFEQLMPQIVFCLSELSFYSYGLSRYPEDEESLWSKKRLSQQVKNHVAIKPT